jgi:hypothetical protein
MDIVELRDEGRLDEQIESFQIAGRWNSGMLKQRGDVVPALN